MSRFIHLSRVAADHLALIENRFGFRGHSIANISAPYESWSSSRCVVLIVCDGRVQCIQMGKAMGHSGGNARRQYIQGTLAFPPLTLLECS